MYYTVLRDNILHYVVIYSTATKCNILYSTILYCTTRHYTILYYTVLNFYYTLPYFTLLCYTILHYTLLQYVFPVNSFSLLSSLLMSSPTHSVTLLPVLLSFCYDLDQKRLKKTLRDEPLHFRQLLTNTIIALQSIFLNFNHHLKRKVLTHLFITGGWSNILKKCPCLFKIPQRGSIHIQCIHL